MVKGANPQSVGLRGTKNKVKDNFHRDIYILIAANHQIIQSLDTVITCLQGLSEIVISCQGSEIVTSNHDRAGFAM